MLRNLAPVLLLTIGILPTALAQEAVQGPASTPEALPEPQRVVEYRRTQDSEGKAVVLEMELFLPPGHRAGDSRAAAVFFFGGGWKGGTTRQMRPFAQHLAQRGMLAACADYRVQSRQGTDPFACVEDAKAAVRYLRGHAAELGIDPERIVVGGGSAGGHLAAATGVLEGFEGAAMGIPPDVSSRPQAMILFNPVLDTSKQGYGSARLKERWKDLSVNHHLRKGQPPSLVFHGTADRTVPFANAQAFQAGMRQAGNVCELVAFEGRGHGFFNSPAFRPKSDGADYADCLRAMDRFLAQHGFLEGEAATAKSKGAEESDGDR